METTCLHELLTTAIIKRKPLEKKLLQEQTDTWRLFHGINEGFPGLTIDRYGSQILIQTFQGPLTDAEIKEIKETLVPTLDTPSTFVYNHREGKKAENIPLEGEPEPDTPGICRELGVKYRIKGVHRGIDPLLFLDLRVGRRYVTAHCKEKSLLNLFAYTCGVGTAAAVAGAKETWNVDFGASNLAYGKENAKLNDLPLHHIRFLHQDVLPVIRQLAGLGVKGKARKRRFMNFKPRQFDMVFLDPPTWAVSPFGAVDIVKDYQGLFKPALLCLTPGGRIICTNHAAPVQLEPWLEQLHRCAEKAGRPITSYEVLEPEPDFPSPDGRHPLKIVAIQA